jgi:hypothetical protein
MVVTGVGGGMLCLASPRGGTTEDDVSKEGPEEEEDGTVSGVVGMGMVLLAGPCC